MDHPDTDTSTQPPAAPAYTDEFQASFHSAMDGFSRSLQRQMLRIEARLTGLENELQLLHQRLNSVDQRLEKLSSAAARPRSAW